MGLRASELGIVSFPAQLWESVKTAGGLVAYSSKSKHLFAKEPFSCLLLGIRNGRLRAAW